MNHHNCLSKQKVKDVIENACDNLTISDYDSAEDKATYNLALRKLSYEVLKELGLSE